MYTEVIVVVLMLSLIVNAMQFAAHVQDSILWDDMMDAMYVPRLWNNRSVWSRIARWWRRRG